MMFCHRSHKNRRQFINHKNTMNRASGWNVSDCGPVLFCLFRFVFFWGFVFTQSMEPTIPAGSLILGTRLLGELEVGDIIVFKHDG